MSYSEYGFTKRSEAQSSYQEYSCNPREERAQSYQEYGDPKMSGTGSLFGSAPRPVDLKAFDAEMERYCEEQRKIKAERLAEKSSSELAEAQEQPAEESVESQTDVTTAETETVPEQPKTSKKKKSKKNTEEVSDAE